MFVDRVRQQRIATEKITTKKYQIQLLGYRVLNTLRQLQEGKNGPDLRCSMLLPNIYQPTMLPIHAESVATESTSGHEHKSVREQLYEQGITLAEWAHKHGYSPDLVYVVARGHRKCLRGESLRIAKELKMK
jgi:gp16 family phage-associated protein